MQQWSKRVKYVKTQLDYLLDFSKTTCFGLLGGHHQVWSYVYLTGMVYEAFLGAVRKIQPIGRMLGRPWRVLNLLTPNDPYMGRTAPLTSKRSILYIYSTNIGTEYFKHALYFPFWCRIHLWFRYVGGFVRKVDDVTAYLAAQPSRLRAHHRNKLSLRVYCCCCRCILHLQQYSRRLNLLRFFFLFKMQFVS